MPGNLPYPNFPYRIKDVDGVQKADVPVGTPDFKIYTGPMLVSPDDPQIVRMVGSSTEEDVHGSIMSLAALGDMTKVPVGMAIFLNHEYTVPESVFGGLADAPTIMQQNGVADLHLSVRVTNKNPRALATRDLIKEGVARLGCSIGCLVKSYEIDMSQVDTEDPYSILTAPMTITGVYPMEWSVVGIPANQRSWVEQAKKGIFARTLDKRLAPAVKSLFPKDYRDIVNRVADKDTREELLTVKTLPRPERQIRWDANRAVFVMLRSGVANDEGTPLDNPVEALHAVQQELQAAVSMAGDTEIQEDATVETTADGEPDTTKTATGSADWPLTDRDVAWDNGEATQAIESWANGDAGKLASVHFYKDPAVDGSQIGAYKLLFCDVFDGSVKAVPKAIFACAGAHGVDAADIPSADKNAIHGKISAWYRKMAKAFKDDTIVAPWDAKKTADETVETMTITEEDADTKEAGEENATTETTTAAVDTVDVAAAATVVADAATAETETLASATTDAAADEVVTTAVDEVATKLVTLDASQAAELALYNMIGTRLGLDEVTFMDGKFVQAAASGAGAGAGLQAAQALVKQADNASDALAVIIDNLCNALGMPSDADEAGASEATEGITADTLLTKLGNRHNAEDMKSIQAIHDATVHLTNGMVCAATPPKKKPADGEGDASADAGGDDSPGAIEMGAEPQRLAAVTETLEKMAAALAELKLTDSARRVLTAQQEDADKMRDYLASYEASLTEAYDKVKQLTAETAVAKQVAMDALKMADGVSRARLGRPTGLLGRTYEPGEGAAEFAEMMNLTKSSGKVGAALDKELHLSGQSELSYDELVKHLEVEYEAGVGYVRLWPEGITPQGGRPELTNAQRVSMTVEAMVAYKEGRAARVPVI